MCPHVSIRLRNAGIRLMLSTTETLKQLKVAMDYFIVAQVDFDSQKRYNQVRKVWDKNRLGALHCNVRAAVGSVILSHNHVLNDVILDCLQKEYSELASALGTLNTALKDLKQFSEIKDVVDTYLKLTDKKNAVTWFVSDVKEISDMFDLNVDIKQLISGMKG